MGQRASCCLVINTGRNLDLERDAIEMMLERQVEAFIYATMYHRAGYHTVQHHPGARRAARLLQ